MGTIRRCELERIFGKYLSESEYTDRAGAMSLSIPQFKASYRHSYPAGELRKILTYKKRLLMAEAERHPAREVPESIIEGGYDSMGGRGLSKEEKKKVARGFPRIVGHGRGKDIEIIYGEPKHRPAPKSVPTPRARRIEAIARRQKRRLGQ